jgi:acyl-CoA synthetase (AMP-forming)/AMP-acid ligase II
MQGRPLRRGFAMTIYSSPYPAAAVPNLSITQLVFDGLAGRGDEVVLTDAPTGREMTASAFMAAVQSLAGGLVAHGLGRGAVVALMAPNLPEFAVIFHATAWAGLILTTLNPTYTAEEARHQLQDSGAVLLITIPAFLATATEAVAGTAVADIAVIGAAPEEAMPLAALMGAPLAAQVPVDLDRDTVVLPYSSGTTGLPKGVMLSHRNLVANVEQSVFAFDLRPGDTALAFLPFFHIYGMQCQMNSYLARGGQVITMPRFDLELFLRMIQTHRLRGVMVVPPVTLALAKHPMVDQFDLSSLEWVLSAAAPLGAELSQACAARLGCKVRQGYGMTELSPVSHVVPDAVDRPGSAGVAVGSTECRLVDEQGRDVAPGAEGEVWIRGPQVMLGYLNNPEATTRTLTPDGWLKTGDLARIDAEGHLFILDRVKELIKVKGFQVAPAELEALIVSHPQVADCAVVGRPDDEAGEVPVAFVVPRPGAELTADQVMAHLTGRVAHYKQLAAVHFVEAIPKSASGKILRRLLRGQA